MTVPCLILAGGKGSALDERVACKSLVVVAGRPMVEWVADAARGAEAVSEITVVVPGDDEACRVADLADRVIVSNTTLVGNLLAGIEGHREDERVLVLTADIPAITPHAIDDYITESLERRVDLTYPIVPRRDMEREFPGSRRTYVRVDGQDVTGGNMVLLTPWLVRAQRGLGERLSESRKSALRLAGLLGPTFAAKYMTGFLRVSDVERRMETLSGGKCAALWARHASTGADIDKPADVVVLERVLYSRVPRMCTGD